MSTTSETSSGSSSPRSSPSSLQKERNALSKEGQIGMQALEFSDFIKHIKQIAQQSLQLDGHESEGKLLEALEDMFEKEGSKFLSVQAFKEAAGEGTISSSSATSSRNFGKSFHEAELMKCIVRLVWLELKSEAFPASSEQRTLQLRSREKVTHEQGRAVRELRSNNRPRSGTPMDSDPDPAYMATNSTANLRLIMNNKKVPETPLEQISLGKGVWCHSSRKTCADLEALFPDIEPVAPPLTYRLNGHEVHVYNIAVPTTVPGKTSDVTLTSLNLDFWMDKPCSRWGIPTETYFVRVPCSERECTKKWKPW